MPQRMYRQQSADDGKHSEQWVLTQQRKGVSQESAPKIRTMTGMFHVPPAPTYNNNPAAYSQPVHIS